MVLVVSPMGDVPAPSPPAAVMWRWGPAGHVAAKTIHRDVNHCASARQGSSDRRFVRQSCPTHRRGNVSSKPALLPR